MAKVGLNVPPGFTITTDVCAGVCAGGGALPPGVWEDVLAALAVVEKATGKSYGGGDGEPLLVSVRSGAALSMPGEKMEREEGGEALAAVVAPG